MTTTQDINLSVMDSDNELPTYHQAINDPPPSYKSLYGDIRKVKQQSDGNVDFARSACTLCCAVVTGSVGFLICLAIGTAIPITMVVIGSIYIDDCPAERYIPIYLVVSGGFALLAFVIRLLVDIRNHCAKEEGETEKKEVPSCVTGLLCLISCFSMAWFIAGNVWVYRTSGEWKPDSTASDYCHPTLYYFAFWLITTAYILMGVTFLFSCCIGCIAACSKKE